MNSFNEKTEATQTTPEIPPEFPFNPSEPDIQPSVPVPMIYVGSNERIEYRVKALVNFDARELEKDLNALGKEGWWLIQVIQRETTLLLVFSRKSEN